MSQFEEEQVGPTPGQRFWKFVKRSDVRETLLWAVFYIAVFVILALFFYTKWMPERLSTNMESIERLMVIFTIISTPVFGLVLSMATYELRHAKRGDTPPPDGWPFRTNRLGIFLFSTMAGVLTLVAVVYGITSMNSDAIAAEKNAEDAMVVEVIGNQWVWNFKYPDLNVESNELALPIGKPVKFLVHSVDVNHSFWPVQLGVKADANPVSVVQINTTPNKIGKIDVKCAELCGLYHAYMETNGYVMSEGDFNNWVLEHGGKTA